MGTVCESAADMLGGGAAQLLTALYDLAVLHGDVDDVVIAGGPAIAMIDQDHVFAWAIGNAAAHRQHRRVRNVGIVGIEIERIPGGRAFSRMRSEKSPLFVGWEGKTEL